MPESLVERASQVSQIIETKKNSLNSDKTMLKISQIATRLVQIHKYSTLKDEELVAYLKRFQQDIEQ
jgi:hypothetical protein